MTITDALCADTLDLLMGSKYRILFPRFGGTVYIVAHVDTVRSEGQPSLRGKLLNDDGIISVMGGGVLGADDRAGVYAALQLYNTDGFGVILTDGEERGGIGAQALADAVIMKGIRSRFPQKPTALIELDRKGYNDAVCYDSYNTALQEYCIANHGWAMGLGSFSDVSILSPALGVPHVNLSIGYFNEHTRIEYLDSNALNTIIDRVKCLVNDISDKTFDYTLAHHWEDDDDLYFDDFEYQLRYENALRKYLFGTVAGKR